MKKNLVFIFLLFLVSMILVINPVFSQDEPMTIREKPIGTAYSFGDKVNVREKADLKAKVSFQLKIGDKIEIIENTGTEIEVEGKSDYWYKIKKDKQTGYVWGGFIADLVIIEDLNYDGKKEMLLIADKSAPDKKNPVANKNKVGYIIKLLDSKNNFLSEYKMETYGILVPSTPFEYKIIDDPKFNPKVKLIEIEYFQRSEVEYGYIEYAFFYVSNNKLEFAFKPNVSLCDPPYCSETFVIFPSYIGGITNRVTMITHNFDLDKNEPDEFLIKNYEWNGKKFVETKD